MADEGDREGLVYKMIDDCGNVWIGREFLEHLLTVLKAVPIADLQRLADEDVSLFAPDANFGGRVLAASPGTEKILYLSPLLLSQPSDEIQGVIAHEMAHVVLGHKEECVPDAGLDEEAADKLAESWGFKLPASYTSRVRRR